ncbi:tyrosine-type recombinase/integrase [Mycolicibacter virginiensis]|uniref:tyrosine-type recombinase/integrase n=1 Tax=Mycolicibacter virginiensis TaxID=1795032 RepID=UPI001F040A0D|nr:site-specific integrase [Mycolicibacter virginiensis]ULP48613.1 site-specific integrase [Mycolicibacter virginiensis]
MAYIRVRETKQKRKGKPVRAYDVVDRVQVIDQFGLPIPANPNWPNGPKQMRSWQETYPTREEAEARRDELNAAKHTTGTAALAEQRKAGDLPLGHYARAWLDTLAPRVSRGKLKQATADEYARLLRCYVLPELGSTAVARINPARCEAFLAALVRRSSTQGNGEPLSPGTVKHAWDMLRRVLKYAEKHGAVPKNPTAAIDFGGNGAVGDREGFEHHPLTLTQVGVLAAAISGHSPADYIGPALPSYPVYGLMVEFMALTGLRAAELSGLEVGDIVFAPSGDPTQVNGNVRVRRAKFRRGGQWVIGTLKTKNSRRTVRLEPGLAGKIAAYLAEHPRANEPTAPLWPSRKNGGGYRATGQRYAVPLDWSQPLAMGTFYDTIMKPALEAVGLPASRPARAATATAPARPAVRGVRVHDLRHTAAVLWLTGAGGLVTPVHYMRVAQLLGHATHTVTLDTYGDWIEDDKTTPAPLPALPTTGLAPVVNLAAKQAN